MYLLKKFPGKGGWTYAELPEIAPDTSNPFGWFKVRGSVDGYPLKQYKLMPMGNGNLFLPVKKEIRKKIRKEAGNQVHVILFPDSSPIEIPGEILDCLKNEPPEILETFMSYTEGERKAYIDWINKAKSEITQVERIVKMIEKLGNDERLHDKPQTED